MYSKIKKKKQNLLISLKPHFLSLFIQKKQIIILKSYVFYFANVSGVYQSTFVIYQFEKFNFFAGHKVIMSF